MSGGRSWAEIDTDGVEGGLDLVGMEVEGRNDPGCGEMAGGSLGGSEVDKVCGCVCVVYVYACVCTNAMVWRKEGGGEGRAVVKVCLSRAGDGQWHGCGGSGQVKQTELSSFILPLSHSRWPSGECWKAADKHGSSKTRLGPQRSPHPCSSGLLDRPCQAPTQPISHTRPANQSRAGLIV